MFFRRRPDTPRPSTIDDALHAVVRRHMPDADELEVQVLAAVAGLSGCLAYADGEYHPDEARAIMRLLRRIPDLPSAGAEAIGALLDARVAEIARQDTHKHARTLREGTERGARVEILEVLVDLAAADGVITVDETELLRRVTKMMGLSADDYVRAQARHRDKLSVLG